MVDLPQDGLTLLKFGRNQYGKTNVALTKYLVESDVSLYFLLLWRSSSVGRVTLKKKYIKSGIQVVTHLHK